MQFKTPFLRLPVTLDADALAVEVNALPKQAWTPHPDGVPGNDAVVLVSPGGRLTDESIGEMAPTTYLEACPYIMDLMGELGAVWGRSRLMGLGPGAEVPLHVDVHYYWRTHLRVHIPVITNPGVSFTCGDTTVHMAPGECWAFDSFRPHKVVNEGKEKRVHLVLDTVGGGRLADLIEAAERGESAPSESWKPPPWERRAPLALERVNVPLVMSPWEIRCHVNYVFEFAPQSEALTTLRTALDRFIDSWHAAWGQFGTSDEGIATYRLILEKARVQIGALGGDRIILSNGQRLSHTLEGLIFWNAIAREPERLSSATAPAGDDRDNIAKGSKQRTYRERIVEPIFIVSSPRSGSTMLFETVSRAPDLFTAGGESHAIIEGISAFSVPSKGWESNRLTADDADPRSVEQLARAFFLSLRDRDGNTPNGQVRLLEKTPKNALRVPFFREAFPAGTFVYLYRDVRQTLASMMEAWVSGRFTTYPQLPGWTGYPWSLLLVSGWRELIGRPLPEIVARQWAITTSTLIADLKQLPKDRVRVIDYQRFIADPHEATQGLPHSLNLEWDQSLPEQLPLSAFTVSPPDPEKWRRLEPQIDSVFAIVAEADEQARQFVASFDELVVQ